jgi:hypothetical protein
MTSTEGLNDLQPPGLLQPVLSLVEVLQREFLVLSEFFPVLGYRWLHGKLLL